MEWINCYWCNGTKKLTFTKFGRGGEKLNTKDEDCKYCKSTGRLFIISFDELNILLDSLLQIRADRNLCDVVKNEIKYREERGG